MATSRAPKGLYVGTCPICHKHQYRTRQDARRVGRSLYPGHVLRAYRCGEYWHFGHIPQDVRRGERPAP
ncbi:hypothetical protein ACTWP5_27400 [Streptomyces sp. 4N509B]|uniref:hypothetical protein n=1 Tax=Streptomyces sp. 4N509B TaxID=3457413 RepID=UPI003FD3939E